MTRIMGDSSTFGDVPDSVDIVAAYINGHFGVATKAELEAKYPNEKYGHVLVDVNGSAPQAQARDWENGDKAGSLEQWVIDHNKDSGEDDAVVYCNKSTIDEVRQKTGSQILDKDYFLWIATLDGTEYTDTGVIACQNKGANLTGAHWDSSVVYDDRFWKKTGAVLVTPGTKPVIAKPNCVQFQNAIHVSSDNIWGNQTDKYANAVIYASVKSFPYGIAFAQQVVDTKADGKWGPASEAMLRETIIDMQNALDEMGFNVQGVDGAWGTHTSAAYNAARKACHI